MRESQKEKVKSKKVVMDIMFPEFFSTFISENSFLETFKPFVLFFTFHFLIFNFFSSSGAKR